MTASGTSPLRPLVLTALVWPGLGQLSLKQWVRGLVFGLASGTVAGGFMWVLGTEIVRRLPVDEPVIDPLEAWRIAHEIIAESGTVLHLLVFALVGIWALAVADCFLTYRRTMNGPR